MKKLLSLALALLLLAVMLPVVSMADEITWVESKNVYWQAGRPLIWLRVISPSPAALIPMSVL